MFHDFHQTWTIQIKMALNSGRLPKGLSAMVEQRAGSKEPDVLTVESRLKKPRSDEDNNSSVLTLDRPAASIVRRTTKEIYAGRANRIVVKHHLGRIVAAIEIVSPGNKDSRAAFRDFVEKTIVFLRQGIHLLIVDLFPPSPRDPFGIHKAIWDEIHEEDFVFPKGKDRILASYEAGGEKVAYVEPVAVGDSLPDMPLFLATGMHIKVPLESTYQSTWNATPEEMRTAVETGIMPESDADGD
ncbi:MAG TPA: DUF4058 family protein [Gemmataceae bacterium]|nr:DUF4058 family protein [Gemmataceae bacterium]